MKKLVLFDIDNTLFDSSSYRHKFFQEIALLIQKEKNIADAEEFCSNIYTRLRVKLGFFSPHKFARAIVKEARLGKNFQKKIMDIIFSQKSLGNNMFREVQGVLFSLGKITELGIFSQGDLLLQRAKIADVENLFAQDHVHIIEKKIDMLKKIFGMYKGYRVFLIDDALPILFEVKKLYSSVFTIWIKRGRWAEKQKDIPGFQPDKTILKLTEVEKIIGEN